MRRQSVSIALALILISSAPAAAHLGLRSPASRYGDDVLKEGPCGIAGGTRSQHVTVLEPGSQLAVEWDEYVNHPGHFRIAFDADGDDDFVDPACLSKCDTTTPEIATYSHATVLLDEIADTPRGGVSGTTITLPDIECDHCTLQVIQVMYDKPPQTRPGDDIYYQCADLILRRTAPSPTPTPSATATPLPPSATPTATFTRRNTPLPTPTRTHLACVGDCLAPGHVSIDDVLAGIGIALAAEQSAPCLPAFDRAGDGAITVEELVAAVRSELTNCGS